MNLGVIGCGQVASLFHAPAMREIPGIRIQAISDVNEDRVESFGRKHRVERRYTDYHSMLSGGDIDSVLICTPPRTHAQIILDSIDHGMHVLCEKPFVCTTSEMDLVEKSISNNLTVFPAHNYIFTPSLRLAEDLTKKGNLGHLTEVNAHLAVGFNTWRPVTDYRVQDPGGVITDLLYHVVYVVQRLCGPIAAFGNIEVERKGNHVVDKVYLEGRLENDAHAELSASWRTLLPRFKIMLRYSEALIETDLIWHPYRVFAKAIGDECLPKPNGGRYDEIRSLVSMAHPSFRFMHQDFLSSVASKSTPRVTVDHARETILAIERIVEQAGT